MKQDFEALEQLADSVRDERITEILQKQEEGKKLTSKEKLLLDRRIALDSFSDVMTMELEDVQELLQDVKSARKESIQRLNNRKEERRKKVEEKQKEFNEQMENDFGQLYDENGNPLNENGLQKNRQFIRKAFKEKGLFGLTFTNNNITIISKVQFRISEKTVVYIEKLIEVIECKV